MRSPPAGAILLAGVLMLGGCAPSIEAQYEAAIARSAVKRPGDAAVLAPILDDPVKAVSWSPYGEAFKKPPGFGSPLYGETWITTDTHLKDRCAAFPRERLVTRIEQLLGLPPGAGAGRQIVSFEVARKDVFRPCADPSVETTRCPTLVPPVPEGAAVQGQGPPDAHLRWLAGQMMSSYRAGLPAGQHGYPFTGLGYTYDWAPESRDNVGLSEYVVRKGARITNVQVTPTEAFCRR